MPPSKGGVLLRPRIYIRKEPGAWNPQDISELYGVPSPSTGVNCAHSGVPALDAWLMQHGLWSGKHSQSHHQHQQQHRLHHHHHRQDSDLTTPRQSPTNEGPLGIASLAAGYTTGRSSVAGSTFGGPGGGAPTGSMQSTPDKSSTISTPAHSASNTSHSNSQFVSPVVTPANRSISALISPRNTLRSPARLSALQPQIPFMSRIPAADAGLVPDDPTGAVPQSSPRPGLVATFPPALADATTTNSPRGSASGAARATSPIAAGAVNVANKVSDPVGGGTALASTAAANVPRAVADLGMIPSDEAGFGPQAGGKSSSSVMGPVVLGRHDDAMFNVIDVNVCRRRYADYLLTVAAYHQRAELLKAIWRSEVVTVSTVLHNDQLRLLSVVPSDGTAPAGGKNLAGSPGSSSSATADGKGAAGKVPGKWRGEPYGDGLLDAVMAAAASTSSGKATDDKSTVKVSVSAAQLAQRRQTRQVEALFDVICDACQQPLVDARCSTPACKIKASTHCAVCHLPMKGWFLSLASSICSAHILPNNPCLMRVSHSSCRIDVVLHGVLSRRTSRSHAAVVPGAG